jgi:hypothetical protein
VKIPSGFLVFLLVAAITLPSRAKAATFSEGKKDAGQTLATARAVNSYAFGTPLETITGAIRTKLGNADLYQIYIAGNTFSADTRGDVSGHALNDTQLFLFDSSGRGVFANDDESFDSLRSHLSLGELGAGVYYLGISAYGYNPVNKDGSVFDDQGVPVGLDPLKAWVLTKPRFKTDYGTYSIALTGATFVPEPSGALGLFAFAGLVMLRRR